MSIFLHLFKCIKCHQTTCWWPPSFNQCIISRSLVLLCYCVPQNIWIFFLRNINYCSWTFSFKWCWVAPGFVWPPESAPWRSLNPCRIWCLKYMIPCPSFSSFFENSFFSDFIFNHTFSHWNDLPVNPKFFLSFNYTFQKITITIFVFSKKWGSNKLYTFLIFDPSFSCFK